MPRARYLAVIAVALTLLPYAFAAGKRRPPLRPKSATTLKPSCKIPRRPQLLGCRCGFARQRANAGAINEDKLFAPASNAKLFTTAAVFGLIGPDYRFKTTVETMGTLDKYGRLDSDVVLVGRGDPNLSGRTLPYSMHTERKAPPIQVLQQLADQLVQHGLKYVDGDVVADDSYFVWERYGEGWSQDDLAREWGAPVSALTINDNVIFVNIMPADRPGERAFLSITPFPEYYKIDNRVMTTPAGSEPRTVSINREPGSNVITFWGNIPQDDPGFGEALAIEDPADFAARLLRELLEERGVTVYGRTRTRHTELASTQTFSVTSLASGGGDSTTTRPPVPTALVLASYQSQPIVEDLRVINKVSQNLHAELMLRLLGKEKGTSGSIEGGLEVLRSFLVERRRPAGPIRLLRWLGPFARGPRNPGSHRRTAALRLAAALGQGIPGHPARRRDRRVIVGALPQHSGDRARAREDRVAHSCLRALRICDHAVGRSRRVFDHHQRRYRAHQEGAGQDRPDRFAADCEQ